MFSIEADFNDSDLEAMIQEDLQAWFDEITEVLMEAGKDCIDRQIAKQRADVPGDGGGFGNITYDLRSSMGCAMIVNGKITETYFPFTKTSEGKQQGMSLLETVAGEIDEEIALALVAGEFYSVFVESKGYDVLTMGKNKLEIELDKLFA